LTIRAAGNVPFLYQSLCPAVN